MFLTRRSAVIASPFTGIAHRVPVSRRPRLALLVALVLFGSSMLLLQAGTLNADGFFAIQRWTRALPDTAWAMITLCGTGIAAVGLLSPTLAWQPRWMAALLAAVAPAGLYSILLKRLFVLPRPAGVLDSEQIQVIGQVLRTHSFPSGHAITAFTLAAVLVYGSRRPCVTALWVVPFASLIAMSRIAVGAHWPADLASGAAGGWIAGALGVAAIERWRSWNSRRGIRAMALAVIGIGGALFALDLGYSNAVPLQHALGVLSVLAGTVALLRPRLDSEIRF